MLLPACNCEDVFCRGRDYITSFVNIKKEVLEIATSFLCYKVANLCCTNSQFTTFHHDAI